MVDDIQTPLDDEQDDKIKRLLVKIAWGQTVLFALVAFVATWILGLESEIILGWIILVFLCALSLFSVYGVRKAILGTGALGVAVLFLLASFYRQKGWSVETSQLLEWALGSVAFAIGLFAWDAKQQQTFPAVAWAAGLIAFLGFIVYAVMADIYGPTVVCSTKGLLSLAVLAGFYGLAEGRWKKFISFAALIAMGSLLLKIISEGPP